MARRITTLWNGPTPYYVVATSSGFALEREDYSLIDTNVYSEYADAYDALEDYVLEIGGQSI